MHVLAVNSVQSLFNYYAEQLENTPTLADIQATNKMPEKKEGEEEENEAAAAANVNKKELTNANIPMMPNQVIFQIIKFI